MSAQVIPLRPQVADEPDASANVRVALQKLHMLLTLDPIAGVSPAQTRFIATDAGKARLSRCLSDAGERDRIATTPAYAIVAYDFPFALSLMLASRPGGSDDQARAMQTATRSAGLQGEVLSVSARSAGLDVHAVASFDAAAIKNEFLPDAPTTVVFVGRLTPTEPTPGET